MKKEDTIKKHDSEKNESIKDDSKIKDSNHKSSNKKIDNTESKKNNDSEFEINKLKDELKSLKDEFSKQKDLLFRTAAEYDNYRKRNEKEKSAIYSDATASAILEILPVIDSMEMAVNAQNGAGEEYKKGLEMIMNQFNNSLKKLNVEEFGQVNDKFNPDLHNAISHIEDDKLDENVIANVFQKGYKIGDKIIRHAMVQVAN